MKIKKMKRMRKRKGMNALIPNIRNTKKGQLPKLIKKMSPNSKSRNKNN